MVQKLCIKGNSSSRFYWDKS